jgi:hypothetical protein
MPTPERRAADGWRPFHDDEARSLQVFHEPIRDDARHVANPLSAAVAQRVGERLGEVFGRGGFQVDVRHGPEDSPGLRTKKELALHGKAPPRVRSAGPMRGDLEVDSVPVRAVFTMASSGLTWWTLPTHLRHR